MMMRSWRGLTFIDFDSRLINLTNVTAWIGLGRVRQYTCERSASVRSDDDQHGEIAPFDRRMFLPTHDWAWLAWAGSADRTGPAVRDSAARGADVKARSASRWRRAAGLCVDRSCRAARPK